MGNSRGLRLGRRSRDNVRVRPNGGLLIMSKFIIEINIDNSAYQDMALTTELVRNLETIIDKVTYGHLCGPIKDVNGNRTGIFKIEGAE